jgi:hypothetical protein
MELEPGEAAGRVVDAAKAGFRAAAVHIYHIPGHGGRGRAQFGPKAPPLPLGGGPYDRLEKIT